MMMLKKKYHLCLFTLVFLFASSHVFSQERILSFQSDIQIAADASMVVSETIQVRAEGNDIRRGIYRDFPTTYTDKLGNDYSVGFEVLEVTRDDLAESWRIENRRNGVRIYIGSADVLLEPGEYNYLIRYRTSRQIGYFDDHDELYWNVTGNGWGFPIERAQASVSLPESVSASLLAIEGYTGPTGASNQDYIASVAESGASIETTSMLQPYSGLTLVMSWPKGVVAEPDAGQRLMYLLEDNRGLAMSLLTLIAVLTYMYVAWSKVGRDPEAGTIFPHYAPPKGYSPASASYIYMMGYDNKALTAAIINLAVKGHVLINKNEEVYTLKKTESEKPLAPGEQVLLEKLFVKGKELVLSSSNQSVLSKAKTAHKGALKRDYLNIYFSKNTGLLWPSIVASFVMLVVTFVTGSFVPMVALVFVVIIILHFLFAYLLQAPSIKGRLLMDKLEGFKLYLEVAEKDDVNSEHPPELTSGLFEIFLPYAIALNVEQAWAGQFTKVFEKMASVDENLHYHPVWYGGAFNVMNLTGFTKEVSSSLTHSIASASTPPSTSSGVGGGGFSGGGGGGGGGGGW